MTPEAFTVVEIRPSPVLGVFRKSTSPTLTPNSKTLKNSLETISLPCTIFLLKIKKNNNKIVFYSENKVDKTNENGNLVPNCFKEEKKFIKLTVRI